MKTFDFNRSACSCAAIALLTGCGGLRQAQDEMQPPIGAPGAMTRTSTVAPSRVGTGATYQVLYRFKLQHGVGSGQSLGGLVDVDGTLYGTTQLGGGLGRRGCCGTVYRIATTGKYSTVYDFRGHRRGDGEAPRAGLIDVNGTLYGTTASGGSSNHGTVYSISARGAEQVLHSFAGGTDGAFPTTNLFYYIGTGILYGTTSQGGYYGSGCGPSGCGTVYSITTSGEEQVMYAFKGGSDGATPSSALIVYTDNAPKKGPRVMYGTTTLGGGTGCGGSGCGTVYSITTSGQEKVLYSFAGGADGSQPGGVDDDGGTLYGTTLVGGKGCRAASGCGTVFSMSTDGYKQVVYNFRGGSDGYCPNGPLIDIDHRLYGTTACGGGCSTEPCGTVYSLTPGGTEQVLYRFTNSVDGFSPDAPLTRGNATLYGTTLKGGGSGKGFGRGVIYALHK